MTRPHLIVLSLGIVLGLSCADRPDDLTGPSAASGAARSEEVRAAIAAQERHTRALLRIPGVLGTAVGLLPNGRAAVRIFVTSPDVRGLPPHLHGVPVTRHVTGLFVAFGTPTTRARPAPVGYSVGHPFITAGTIGARVRDAAGNVYLLSNNHVLAAANDAGLGDAILQPGPLDGGGAADQIGTLFAFKAMDFSFGGQNTMDAAIALSSAADLSNATPSDDGYGMPASRIFGDADANGVFDDKTALLGVNVQKYGRTTKLTKGRVTGINGTVRICYQVLLIFCTKPAVFVDQLIIEPGPFSGGGDSGSLIATDDANKNPVGLLFAGSSTQTIANRIDLVLNHFGVTVDGAETPPPPPPPTPVTDIAVAGVTAPASVTQGATAFVRVTVQNTGNQNVSGPFDVALRDATDGAAIGTQSVPGLAAGTTVTLTFAWNTGGSSIGSHTLTASQALADDNAANNQASVTVAVGSGSVVIHVGDLDATASRTGKIWSARVAITVHDADHGPVNGATVVGRWSVTGLNSNSCTTGDLGGGGSCVMLFPSLKKGVTSVRLTVVSVTLDGRTYDRTLNHDVDGGSNGTTITVRRP